MIRNIAPRLARGAAAVCTGVLLASAYPPFDYAESAWVALAPLLLLARYSAPFEAFRWGLVAGAVFWLTSLSWLLALARTGGPPIMVAIGWLLLAGYCAFYIGMFAMTVAWLWKRVSSRAPAAQGVLLTLAIPLLWVGFEYLRSVLFTGFAWNQLGVSQYRSLAVIQVADRGGVYAVSALLAIVNTALTFMVLRFADVYLRRQRSRFNIELMLGLIAWVVFLGYGIRTVNSIERGSSSGCPMVITAIQPNIPQLKKWPPDYAQEICHRLERQTRLAAMQNPDLIIWPETSLPGAIGAHTGAADFVRELALLGVPLLVGSMEEQRGGDEMLLYNSSFLFDSDGQIVDRYRKRHLVPFGEYIPFENQVPLLKSMAPLGFSCTPGEATTVFRLPAAGQTTSFSVLICFEDTVASLARLAVRRGARLLINQTNDAWFDNTAAAMQHMSHCVFRCVENRVPAVRCTNNGVTSFIDRVGRVAMLENEADVVYSHKTDKVTTASDDMSLTFYSRFGDLPFAIPCAVFAVAVLAFSLKPLLHRRSRTEV